MVMTLVMAFLAPQIAVAYNFGDYRSATLATKAWDALKAEDLEAVLAYTNKCLELYADPAKKMQESLFDYPTGDNDEIFSYWAAYQQVVDEYTYGQCWDVGGWFWKPAEAAKEKIAMIESGSDLDFGDYKSATLTAKAWQALNSGDLEEALAYTEKCIELYADQAAEMQNSLTEYPWESKEKIFSYWALNDVGTSYFIRGETYRKDGKIAEAKASYQKVLDDYFYAQCWDPQGWFWKPAEAAQQKIEELSE